MTRRYFQLITGAALVVIALTPAILKAQPSPRELFERARIVEEANQDLMRAIRLYERAAAQAKGDRALAAQALIRMAECYQKLGDVESRKIYERVVRDYGDQTDAVSLARARLGASDRLIAVRGDRPVWTGPNVDLFGTVSPDGRFLTFVDWIRTGNLMLRDLVNGADRVLTNNVSYGQFGQASWSAISKDGKHVTYEWTPNETGRAELRIASLQGSGTVQSRRVFVNEEIRGIHPYDWSPDGKWIAVCLRRQDQTGQIGLVAVQDGAVRNLKSIDWREPAKIVFSPDGRYIAYDLPVSDTGDQQHVFILATDGSHETVAVAHSSRNVVMGWSDDGQQHLLFASNRSGAMGLWALFVADGKPEPEARLVRANIGSELSLGLASSGALYVYKNGDTGRYVRAAPIDLNAGKLLPMPSAGFQRFIGGGGSPSWSPDGKYLAYVSCRFAAQSAGGCAIAIASVETGAIRELHPKMAYLGNPRWARDGRSLTTDGTDLVKGLRAIYRIDAQTGDVSLVTDRPGAIFQWGEGERKLYYRREIPSGAVLTRGIFEKDLLSGKEREVRRGDLSVAVSPDGRYIASVESDKPSVILIPVAGGEPKELVRANPSDRFDGFRMTWTPDNSAVIVAKIVAPGQSELWLIPVDGGERRKLDIDIGNWVLPGGGYSVNPDGRQIAFIAESGKQSPEVWVLENVLTDLLRSLSTSAKE